MKTHCCNDMEYYTKLNCDIHNNIYECPDVIVSYILKFDEYGIIIHDGGESSISIQHCLWCGCKLPNSKRDLWYEKLESLGYDDYDLEDLPKEFLSDEWYLNIK